MNRNDLRRVDLNLSVIFEALMFERNLTRVAEKLFMGQPAVRREEAPGIIVVVRRANYLLMPALLASGETSVGVSYTTDLPANAKRKKLRDIGCKVLRGDTRPVTLTLDEYCTRPSCDGVLLGRPEWQHRS